METFNFWCRNCERYRNFLILDVKDALENYLECSECGLGVSIPKEKEK